MIHQPLMQGLCLMLLVAVVTDLSFRKIPNLLVGWGLLFSLILQFLTHGSSGAADWMIGVVIGFVGFIPLYILRGMAAGDVKLMMAVGGFIGYPLIIHAMGYAILAGAVLAACQVLITGRFRQLFNNMRLMLTHVSTRMAFGQGFSSGISDENSVGRMPYALGIAIGTLIAVSNGNLVSGA